MLQKSAVVLERVLLLDQYYSSSFHLAMNVEPAVNRQPGFRRELVEQITLIWIFFTNFPASEGPQIIISGVS